MSKLRVLGCCLAVWVLCSRIDGQDFDCVDIFSNLEALPPDCPDPAEEPWCACLETTVTPTTVGEYATIVQELIYVTEQPTAGTYIVDVSGGTLDLSSVAVGDEVMTFLVDVYTGQPEDFILDFRGIVTEKNANSILFDIVLQEVNQVTQVVLDYCDGACSPTDEQHSFGKLYEGMLTSRGPDGGFTFEYTLIEPDPLSASPMRALEDGDLDAPNFSIPALVTITDAAKKLYRNPTCNGLTITTTLVPKVLNAPLPAEYIEKVFETTVDFPPCALTFRRGDPDQNNAIELTDAIQVLTYLFIGTPTRVSECEDAADADDNGLIELTDAVRILGYLFLGNTVIPDPGPTNCGPDVGDDGLGPCVYEC